MSKNHSKMDKQGYESTECYEFLELPIPLLADNICTLGQLYNAYTTELLPFNIFAKQEKNENEAVEAPKSTNHLYRLDSYEDVINAVNLPVPLDLELLAGFLQLFGGPQFLDEPGLVVARYFYRKRIERKVYSVKRPDSTVYLESTMNCLTEEHIAATHYIRSMTVGVELEANIVITEKDGHIKGARKLLEKLPKSGEMTTSMIKALKELDTDKARNVLNVFIYINSVTNTFVPAHVLTFAELFEYAEYLETDQVTDREIVSTVDVDFNGVGYPIGFTLTGLRYLAGFYLFQCDCIYKFFSVEDANVFKTFLVSVRDWQAPCFVRDQVIKSFPSLKALIKDGKSYLSINIKRLTQQLHQNSSKLMERFKETFQLYKRGLAKIENLKMAATYDSRLADPAVVKSKINELVAFGKAELKSIHVLEIEVEKLDIEILASVDRIASWWNTGSSPKVLLKTSSVIPKPGKSVSDSLKIPHYLLVLLYALSPYFKKAGVEIGVALPSISDNSSISCRQGDRTMVCGYEHVFNVLAAIGSLTRTKSSTEKILYLQAADLKFSPKMNSDVTILDIVTLLKVSPSMKIFSTPNDTLKELRNLDDNAWTFFVTLDTWDTALPLFKYIRSLENTFSFGKFVVGPLGIDNITSGPMMMVFLGKQVQAVCLDYFDIMLMASFFEETNVNNGVVDLSVLSSLSLRSSLYEDRALYALSVIKLVYRLQTFVVRSSEIKLANLPLLSSEDLTETRQFIRKIAKNARDDKVLETLVALSAKYNEYLLNILETVHWSVKEEKFLKKLSQDDWKFLHDKLEENLTCLTGNTAEVHHSFRTLVRFERPVNKMELIYLINRVCDDKECSLKLKESIKGYAHVLLNAKKENLIKVSVKKLMDEFNCVDFLNHKDQLYAYSLLLVLKQKVDACWNDRLDFYAVIPMLLQHLVDPSGGIPLDRQEEDGPFSTNLNSIISSLQNRQNLHLLTDLSKCIYHPTVQYISSKLNSLSNLDEATLTKVALDIFRYLENVSELERDDLVCNTRIAHLIGLVINDKKTRYSINECFPNGFPASQSLPAMKSLTVDRPKLTKTKILVKEALERHESILQTLLNQGFGSNSKEKHMMKNKIMNYACLQLVKACPEADWNDYACPCGKVLRMLKSSFPSLLFGSSRTLYDDMMLASLKSTSRIFGHLFQAPFQNGVFYLSDLEIKRRKFHFHYHVVKDEYERVSHNSEITPYLSSRNYKGDMRRMRVLQKKGTFPVHFLALHIRPPSKKMYIEWKVDCNNASDLVVDKIKVRCICYRRRMKRDKFTIKWSLIGDDTKIIVIDKKYWLLESEKKPKFPDFLTSDLEGSKTVTLRVEFTSYNYYAFKQSPADCQVLMGNATIRNNAQLEIWYKSVSGSPVESSGSEEVSSEEEVEEEDEEENDESKMP